MDHDNMRLLRLEKAEYLIPAKDVESVDTRLQRRNPPIDYSIVPLPPPQDPLARIHRTE